MVTEFLFKKNRGRVMPTLTIFTPAYNRAHTLSRTYESLLKQSNKDFEWLIIDDGSRDNTTELVKEWSLKKNGFKIQYIYKENGGMHTAHNLAYEKITTELNVCIDSDDVLAEEAVEKILSHWRKVRSKGYCGIIGLDEDMRNGKVIGKAFPPDMVETTLSQYYASGGKGDKKLVYRTDLIKKTPPYPVFPGEKYVGLGYKYSILDLKYKLSVLNEVLCKVDYQESGSSNNMFRQYLNNPKGFAFIRKWDMKHPITRKRHILNCVYYCSSSFISNNRNYIKESPEKLLTILCTPAGWILTVYIKYKAGVIKHDWEQ